VPQEPPLLRLLRLLLGSPLRRPPLLLTQHPLRPLLQEPL
jgi:hypothetical protein